MLNILGMSPFASENNWMVKIISRKGPTSRLKKSSPLKFLIPSPLSYLLMQFDKPLVVHRRVNKKTVRGQSKLNGENLALWNLLKQTTETFTTREGTHDYPKPYHEDNPLYNKFSFKIEWSSHSGYFRWSRCWKRRL